MKKIIIIAMCLMSSSLFSQNLIGKVQHVKCFEAGAEYWIEYSDTKYYQIDIKKEIELTEDEFNSLFNSIIVGFNESPEEPVLIETEKDLLRLKYIKAMGTVNLRIFHHVAKSKDVIGVTKYLTKKAVIRLFGKR